MEYYVGHEYIVNKREQRHFANGTMFYIKAINFKTVLVRTNTKKDVLVPRFYFDLLIRNKRVLKKEVIYRPK